MKFGKPAFCEVNGLLDPERDKMAPKHTWTNWRHLNHQWYSRQLATLPRNSRLIDIGCGAGWFRDLSVEFDTLAIDFIPFSYVNLLADITQRLPVEDGCVDVVMLSNALEHVYNPADLLCEIRRILKPGGRLFLTVPFLVKVHQAPYDFFRYTPYALDRMLKKPDSARWRSFC